MKPLWLSRRIARPGPYLALCLSEADYRAVVRRLKPNDVPRWVNYRAGATTHTFRHMDGKACCVVCIDRHEGRNPIEVAGLLIHEAVHVWQEYCLDMGEHSPGVEQEAYAIQGIAQELLAEYARRMAA